MIEPRDKWATLMRAGVRLDKWIAKLERRERHLRVDRAHSLDILGVGDALDVARADRPVLAALIEQADAERQEALGQ